MDVKICRKGFSFCVMVLAAAAGSTLGSATSKAQMAWRFQNVQSEPVALAFYSQNRKHEWPGGGKAYSVPYSATLTYRYNLECNPGERICFGAWVTQNSTKSWGVGRNGVRGCSDCCFYCDGTVATKQIFR
jgi:hypothetical protein